MRGEGKDDDEAGSSRALLEMTLLSSMSRSASSSLTCWPMPGGTLCNGESDVAIWILTMDAAAAVVEAIRAVSYLLAHSRMGSVLSSE